ncbi:hypothetical protein GCM10023189_50670 [Nibrella saemangeumensis]|uniref:Uncharacterized protein n=1 Tax=Nibrella saemangeumensis TaxID=1084526 RepID=A0ABP8NHV1_9BACT
MPGGYGLRECADNKQFNNYDEYEHDNRYLSEPDRYEFKHQYRYVFYFADYACQHGDVLEPVWYQHE